MVVMVIHSLPLESSPPLRWWSWSYTAFLLKALLLFWIEALRSILGKLWCTGLVLSLIHVSSPPLSGLAPVLLTQTLLPLGIVGLSLLLYERDQDIL